MHGRSHALLLAAALLFGAGCTEHMVGPARTADDFERKSRTTAQVVLSAVETVRLVADATAAGNVFGTYAGVTISEQEDDLAGAQGDFDSIQPPDSAADALRDRLDDLIASAADHVADVRIAVRRSQRDDLDRMSEVLADDADALRAFLDQIS